MEPIDIEDAEEILAYQDSLAKEQTVSTHDGASLLGACGISGAMQVIWEMRNKIAYQIELYKPGPGDQSHEFQHFRPTAPLASPNSKTKPAPSPRLPEFPRADYKSQLSIPHSFFIPSYATTLPSSTQRPQAPPLGFLPLPPPARTPLPGPPVAMSEGKDSLDLSGLGAAFPNAADLSVEDKANLVASIKNTLEGLASRHMDVLENLEPKVKKRVEKLREIQNQHDELEAKFFEERVALEAKYQKMYEPLYSKRYEIVNGVIEVEGITKESADETTAEQKSADETPAEQKEEKGVPDFWLNAMKNHEILAEEIQERDEEALKYLKDIKWYRISEPKGFKLEFHFDTNPFFKNSVLTKTYHMIDEDEPILEKAIGTEIEWYPGKCLTQKVLKKKPRKGSKNTKPITKTEDCESFFNFFSPPQVPDDDEEIDEDTAEQLQNQMEEDYDIGSTIRDKIIPHAVSWFTGEAGQDEDFEGIIDDDEDDDDDDDEDEDEDDEEDEDDGGKKSKGAAAGEGEQGERPAECKQQ